IVNLQSGTTRRDYLKITYASDDSLYIPMESLDSIQKYVGTEGRKPKLSRLGGQDWNRMKERARGSIRKLAIDLVALYAQRREYKGHAFSPDSPWQLQFEEDFPYPETQDQINAIREIKKDMESDQIMDRLLCGDVGFGKTEVAFRAIFKCIMDNKQAVMLAPTTVLVQQHYENLKERLEGYPVNIGLLSRFASPAEMKKSVKGLNDGSVDVVVGTHRLLSKDISPKDLGLLVVDEEQRFGVEHKEKIKSLRSTVDVLTLTATPIPRTLQMSLSGIRDISVIEEPPQDRRPVQTYVLEYDADMLADACLREISRNGQVFYLFNDTHRIEEKVIELEKVLPGARIVMGHGKMAERQLERVIEGFIRHEADILVCTTIIESGIDMPNVNTLIVENAERFGLAQLYQLRGRVGRSDRQAYAYITYRRDKILTEEAQKRLAAIRDFTELGSGFKIALKDLEVRGAGNLLGSEQHGQMDVIGYELYCRMLDEEIKNLQGIDTVRPKEAIVDIDIDAYLPPNYISDEGQRMDAYRRIAAISGYKDYTDVLEELADRYGKLPAEAYVLTDIAYVRHMAAVFDFTRVTIKDGAVFLYYAKNAHPNREALSRALAHSHFAGRILLSAMSKPHVRYDPKARSPQSITSRLRQFFMLMEGMEVVDENS
ncbi:MAG: transcription-repair coupling factor, partial [Clostridiales bacterium]|nr:transcription-repair coupling factor [Clostridiales bacterium]